MIGWRSAPSFRRIGIQRKAADVSPVNTSTKRIAVSKIALTKRFKYALVTELQLLDTETQ